MKKHLFTIPFILSFALFGVTWLLQSMSTAADSISSSELESKEILGTTWQQQITSPISLKSPAFEMTNRDWVSQTVDAKDAGAGASLALDRNDRPHISYWDYRNGDLKYAHWNGSMWISETIATTGYIAEILSAYTSLALDRNDLPHISYWDYSNGDLKYAYWNGNIWILETVNALGRVGSYTTLALDGNDVPHISYRDVTNESLKYAYKDNNAWILQTVDETGGVGLYNSLALDSAGKPHISYYAGANTDLKYAYWEDSRWVSQTVETTGVVGLNTSIAIDSQNVPHISYLDYSDRSNGYLKYAYLNDGEWISQTVEMTGWVALYTSLALDSNDIPHISYLEKEPVYALKYAYWENFKWVTDTVDVPGMVATFSSLALDRNNTPHISYYDVTNHNLKYAYAINIPISGLTAQNNSPNQLGQSTVLTATINSGNTVTYTWDFGDGNFGTGSVVTHTYEAVNTFTAVVTATNPVSTASMTTTVMIAPPAATDYKVYLPVALKP